MAKGKGRVEQLVDRLSQSVLPVPVGLGIKMMLLEISTIVF
jgi:hypothetical protein